MNSSPQPPLPLSPLPPESSELADLQRLMAQAVMRPLTGSERMQARWEDGRRTSEIVGDFIKPNDRLTSFDRLEIYNRQYWFRLLDCLHEDYPGLRALLGDTRFLQLATAYLIKYPSTSPTLRELGSKLVAFISEEPQWTEPYQTVALDMARLEWAQVVAFDGASLPALELKQLAAVSPDRIFLRLQPFISLLALSFPVDEIVLKQDDKLRNEASNAMESSNRPRQRSGAHRVKEARTWLLVHRQENSVYLKRLGEPEYHMLKVLDEGASLAGACEMLDELPGGAEVTAEEVQAWFQTWVALGFLVPAPLAED